MSFMLCWNIHFKGGMTFNLVVLGSLQANTETDGRLNYKEVIENPCVLYTAIPNEDDDYEFHNEFH